MRIGRPRSRREAGRWRRRIGAAATAVALALAGALGSPGLALGQAPAPGPALGFFPVAPCRLVDTRGPVSTTGAPNLLRDDDRPFPAGGLCGVSSAARAISVNLTVVAPLGPGSLATGAAGSPLTATSSLSFTAGKTRANNAIVALGDGAGFLVRADVAGADVVDLVVDVNGFFADPVEIGTGVAPPAMDPPPGVYGSAPTITLRSTTGGAAIRYTLDGTDPSPEAGAIYGGPFVLPQSAEVRAIAHTGGGAQTSRIVAGDYTVAAAASLFLAAQTPQCAAGPLGSGSASLLLAPDKTSAEVRFAFANLTGPIIAKHVHAGDGSILFDLDTAAPVGGVYPWTIVAAGTFTPQAIVSEIEAGRAYINLHTAACPNGEIKGYFTLSTGNRVFTPPPAPPPLPATWNAEDAARFLHQATFGPRAPEIEALRASLQTGGAGAFRAWIDAQMALPITTHIGYLDALTAQIRQGDPEFWPASWHLSESIWKRAIEGPDQLRQRVALALSEMLVISDWDGDVSRYPDGMALYMDTLQRGAFGSFRQLLEEVTLSPMMGLYLDMLGNDKADAETDEQPNENFARELLQLFSIGLYRLNPDGTVKLGIDGLPLPTYGQEEIKGFAAALTGWTFAGQDQSEWWRWYWPEDDPRRDMEPWESHHETAAKTWLDGSVRPAGSLARPDLEAALDQIAAHANVGPFVCRHLIQRLVTSNPSPAYVYRCAQAFANDGTGARGNLGAVVRALLLDYEARSPGVAAAAGYGRLREPMVRIAGLLRSLGASVADGRYRYHWMESPDWGIAQHPLRSPTVFNFFEPTYAAPGEVAQAGLVSPEFKITTETTVFGTPNTLRGVLFYGWMNDDGEVLFDWGAWTGLSNAALLDRVDLVFFGGAMSPETRAILAAALADGDYPSDPVERVQETVWLTFFSPEALIQK